MSSVQNNLGSNRLDPKVCFRASIIQALQFLAFRIMSKQSSGQIGARLRQGSGSSKGDKTVAYTKTEEKEVTKSFRRNKKKKWLQWSNKSKDSAIHVDPKKYE